MTWSLVGSAGAVNNGTGTSLTMSAGQSSTAGNLLVCVFGVIGGSKTASTPSSWALRANTSISSPAFANVYIFDYLNNPGSISSVTVSTTGSGGRIVGQMYEFTCPGASLATADQTGTATDASPSSPFDITTSGNCAASDELAIDLTALNLSTAATVTLGAGSGFTLGGSFNNGTSATGHWSADYRVDSGNTKSATLTDAVTLSTSGAGGMAGAIATYQQPYVIQSASASSTSSTTSLTATLSKATTAGNCLLALSMSGGFATSGVSMLGSSDTFTQAKSATDANSDNISVWTDAGCSGGHTAVVANYTSGADCYLIVYELSGVDTVDVSHSGSGTGTSWSSGTTGTTSTADEFWFGAMVVDAAVTPTGPSSPWQNTTSGALTSNEVMTGYQVATSTSTATYNGTVASNAWAALVVTLEPAPAVTTSGGVSLNMTVSGTVSVANPVTTSGGVSLDMTLSGSAVNAQAITTSGGVSLNMALSGTADNAPNNVSTSGGVSLGMTLAGTAHVPSPVSTSGGVALNMSLSGTASTPLPISTTGSVALSSMNPGGTASVPVTATFPADPLPLLIEIELSRTWTDISQFVYQRDGIQITGGTSDQGSTPQPAQCTMTLDNRDGRFSPKNIYGAYYPNLTRNIQIRVSVDGATSSTGASYTGYRFWGTVADWPPTSDISGTDVYVQITANGPLRQVGQGADQDSPLFRYYQALAAADSANGTNYAPVAYWPVEDDTDSLTIGSGIDGGTDMTVASGTPTWKGSSDFPGSGPVAAVNRSTWTGVTSVFGSSGDDVYDTPGTYTWIASTTSVNCRVWGAGGGGTNGETQSGGNGGNGGGGGAFAQETTLAVTPGKEYTVTVGAGGASGKFGVGASSGGSSSFAGDSVTVSANGGAGATASGSSGGQSAGGAAGSNSVAEAGGKGGYNASSFNGGSGGGGSGGAGGAGGNGANAVSGDWGSGGSAGSGSPPGAAGGHGGYTTVGEQGNLPGAGGGGGWSNGTDFTTGANGASGQVELVYAAGGGAGSVTLTSGTQWVAPTGVSTVKVECWGAGAGGGATETGGGGGGEYAAEATVSVTAGDTYTYSIGQGGAGGTTGNSSGAGGNTVFTAGSTVVTAHGAVAVPFSAGGGTGGHGSTNTTHHNGGSGGASGSTRDAGGGGGSSAGPAAVGGTGGSAVGNVPGAGGAAPTGGGNGGEGGVSASDGVDASAPGGGGGGAGYDTGDGPVGGMGSDGQITITWGAGAGTNPPYNVIRFIMETPSWGGNNGSVLVRAETSGTVARLDCIYVTGGKLQLKGYNSSSTLLFTSSDLTIGDATPVMVSMELVNSSTSVQYMLTAIEPGAGSVLGTVTSTTATASIGSVSQIVVDPNGDCSKTIIGQISVQYNHVGLVKTSNALAGYENEMGVDRFTRVCKELALNADQEFAEATDHWGFENSTQSWAASDCTITSVSTTFSPTNDNNLTIYDTWPPEGSYSLKLDANGLGNPTATSPTGTSGQPVTPGDIVTVSAEFYAPAALSNLFVGILWYQANGSASAVRSEDDCADTSAAAGEMQTLSVKSGMVSGVQTDTGAPSDAAYFAVIVGDHHTDSSGTAIYVDNVRVSSQMGTQTREAYRKVLQQIEDLEQGMLKEDKTIYGLKYRTRFSLYNQTPAVTLDYSANELSAVPVPVFDDKLTTNAVTVHRNSGSRVTVSLDAGAMSTQLPPNGVGKQAKQARVIASDDAQLLALAQTLLDIGTTVDERYPTIAVDLTRSEVAGTGLFDTVPNVEIGDYVQIVGLDTWFPSSEADQLVIGYTETLNAFTWTIEWNCVPESPYEITATTTRRW